MADRPILFATPMVRALLAGTKTQTRRVLKPQPGNDGKYDDLKSCYRALRIEPGDRLWCREAWRSHFHYDDLAPSEMGGEEPIQYEADGAHQTWGYPAISKIGRLRASMYMPRWASRLTLLVTDVRVQRLQDISEEDARAEGCPFTHDGRQYAPPPPEVDSWQGYGRASFSLLWSEINGPGSWDANPWVVAYTFSVHQRNIDAIEAGAAP